MTAEKITRSNGAIRRGQGLIARQRRAQRRAFPGKVRAIVGEGENPPPNDSAPGVVGDMIDCDGYDAMLLDIRFTATPPTSYTLKIYGAYPIEAQDADLEVEKIIELTSLRKVVDEDVEAQDLIYEMRRVYRYIQVVLEMEGAQSTTVGEVGISFAL